MNNEFDSFLRENRSKINDNNVDKLILEAILERIPINYQDVYQAQKYLGGYNMNLLIPSVVTEFINQMDNSTKKQALVAWNHYGEWLKHGGTKYKKCTELINPDILVREFLYGLFPVLNRRQAI